MRSKALEETAPDRSPGAREDRAQIVNSIVTRSYLCGHLHESRGEAQRCAEALAARLSSKPMPPDYYLG
jgi:hypothetical protein